MIGSWELSIQSILNGFYRSRSTPSPLHQSIKGRNSMGKEEENHLQVHAIGISEDLFHGDQSSSVRVREGKKKGSKEECITTQGMTMVTYFSI
jgi:hypothetical protein